MARPNGGETPEQLTDAQIRRLEPPARGYRIVYDGAVKGFAVRVTAAGAKAFVMNYYVRGTGRERRYTIGEAGTWTIGAARIEARRLRRLIDEGGDPLADIEEARQAPTVADLCDRFVEEHLPRRRPGTALNYRILIDKHVRPALKHLKVAEVAFTDIDALHRKVSRDAPYAANRTLAVLSKAFSLAVRWGMRGDNPCKGVEKNDEVKRKRYLSGDELTALTKALASHPDRQAADIVRMLLLTGARRGEVLAMRWADLELSKKDKDGNFIGTWSKPASSTKQNEDHEVPLSAPARMLLTEIRDAYSAKHPRRPLPTFVFPSDSDSGHVVEIKRAWRTICKAAGISGLRVHDLRHSFASQLASAGASLPLIGALLGHSNPTTTHRYAHLFVDPQRAAVEKVATIIGAAGKADAPEPTPFKRRGR
jgi:integrase